MVVVIDLLIIFVICFHDQAPGSTKYIINWTIVRIIGFLFVIMQRNNKVNNSERYGWNSKLGNLPNDKIS